MSENISTRYFSEELISRLLRLEAESNGLVAARNVRPNFTVKPIFTAFEAACYGVLSEYAQPYLFDGVGVEDLMEADGPYLILMTLQGHGVGIWDGRWDHLFKDPQDIEILEKILKEHLSFFADETGGGAIPELLNVVGRLSVGLSAYGSEKGHRCQECGKVFTDRDLDNGCCLDCQEIIPYEFYED